MKKILSQKKQDIITEINSRVEDKVLERSNADLLIKLVVNADNDDEAVQIAALGTTYKRTGLHFDKRLEKPDNTIHYFKKNKELSFGDGKSDITHKLIIGDNYYALLNLLIQYRGGIDVIYIDPPYGKDSMGEFAKTNYENALTRDNLLSMLYTRLILAKQLLSERGVIFCSIDDKNQAYVKCLFDEIFGERNHITCFPKKGTGGRQDSRHFAVVHEYVICYARKIEQFVSGEIDISKKYKNYDEEKKLYYNTQLLRKWGDSSRRKDRPTMFYPIYFNESSNKISIDKIDSNDIEIYPMLDEENEGRWRWEKATMKEALDEELVEIKKQKGKYIPYERLYENPEEQSTKLFSTWIDDIESKTGSKLLKQIVPGDFFSYPKATDLICKLISMSSPEKDLVVLDFFAGSGTTGNAVLDLNASNGNYTFILCQLNEKTETTPNGIAYDVTTKRLKRIMTGECYDGSKDFKWIKYNEPYGGNLDVYEIESIPNNSAVEGKTPFDVIDETLYGKEKMSAKEKIAWVSGNFSITQNNVQDDEEWKEYVKKQVEG